MRPTTGTAYTDGRGAFLPQTERIERGTTIRGERRVKVDACVIGTGAGGATDGRESGRVDDGAQQPGPEQGRHSARPNGLDSQSVQGAP